MKRSRHTIPVAIIILTGCIEPYDIPHTEDDSHFLVVDGFLDAGSGSAIVKLSFAVPIDTNTTVNPASNAKVNIEAEDGSVIPLSETSPGFYTTSSNLIQTGKTYRLRASVNSKDYFSDNVKLKASPILENVTWEAADEGINIFVDSRDVTGATRYYQWNYTETWEYIANRFSSIKWDGKKVVPLREEDLVYTCYGTETSTKVLITSTTTNTADVVHHFPLAFISARTRKLWRLFSIEVEQKAIDEQAYLYWLRLQKTTEGLGGLFDPMPSEVTGNVYSISDPSEPVLGYFSGGEVQKKRIFIHKDEIPARLLDQPGECPTYVISLDALKRDYADEDIYLLDVVAAGGVTASPICVDCRLDGGVTKRPDFWPTNR